MRRFGLAFAVAFGLLVPLAEGQPTPDERGTVQVVLLDVGQGDAILVRSPEGKAALIDAGPSKEIVPLLKQLGVRSLDLVAVSHHHFDHYGGMDDVIREYRPRVFLASDSSYTTLQYLNLLKLVRDSGMQAIRPNAASRQIELGSVTLNLLPQPPEDRAEENNNSLGIRLQFDNFSVLLTGDSEDPERAFWKVKAPELIRDCTVLKLAHHGSRNGIDAAWLRLVRPQLAVASLGAGNDYGHPHPETLALLTRAKTPLLRTDQDGTITITSDGKTWRVTTSREAARPPPPVAKPVNVNTATQAELETLPGIGPALARAIIAGRPYRSVDELRRVKGIGAKTLDNLGRLVAVD